jgi:hypothetical protein
MKLAILSALISGAAAFAPVAQKASTTSSLSASYDKELGVQPPLGFWYVGNL